MVNGEAYSCYTLLRIARTIITLIIILTHKLKNTDRCRALREKVVNDIRCKKKRYQKDKKKKKLHKLLRLILIPPRSLDMHKSGDAILPTPVF